jgi:hypothetical protein
VIADSLNSAKASAPIDKVGPDSAGSVSLTNWISRLHRSPSAGEATPPRSNTLAPAEVADRSAVAAAWQPGGATQPPIASSPSPSSRIGDPRTTAGDSDAGNAGLAAAGRNPKPVGERSLTGWLTRPFRSNNDRDEESLAARPIAPSRSGSNVPVRLPAVTHTAANPSTNGYKRLPPPSATPDIGGASRPGASAAANSGLVGITGSGTPGGNFAQDFSGRVAPATAYQAASDAPNQPRLLPQVSEHSNAWPLAEEAYQSYPPDEAGGNPLGRPKIIFNPVAGMSGNGQATLKPTVQVAHGNDASHGYGYPAMRFAQLPPEAEDSLPPPQGTVPLEGPNGVEGQVVPDGGPVEMTGEPLPEMWVPMDPAYEGPMTAHEAIGPFRECFYTVLAHLNGPRSCPEGIGVENVMNAPFWLDTTQPLQNCRVRGDAAADWEFPDRIEYFWAQTPGPKGAQADFDAEGGEPNVDYQEVSFYIERGGERFSVGTDLPIRAVDPVVRRNTTGFADMRVTTKAVLLDGKDWQLTQVMHTHIPTGSFRRGTGNGHVSLEPGVAWRYKWSDVTYIHGDLTYWFPIAADPFHSGQMFNYGIGISHIWIDGDKWAIMPTLELNAWTVVDGRQTFPGETILPPPMDPGGFEEIDTLSILNIHPGLRWVCDTAGDCGVREFGITSGFTVTEDHWYEEILRIELRWVF